jgi:hypothetical protein
MKHSLVSVPFAVFFFNFPPLHRLQIDATGSAQQRRIGRRASSCTLRSVAVALWQQLVALLSSRARQELTLMLMLAVEGRGFEEFGL